MTVAVPKKTVLGVIAIVVAVGALAIWRSHGSGSYRTDGPLPITDGVQVTVGADAGEVATWGTPLPGSGGKTVVLERIEPVGVQGLEVLAVAVCHSNPHPDPDGNINHCAPIGSNGWPPPGVQTEAVAGTLLPPQADPLVDVVIGARRLSSSSEGRIASVRIVYTADGDTYETNEPWSLRLVAKEGLPSS